MEMDLQPRRGVDVQMDGNVVSPRPLCQIYEYLGSMREWGGMGKEIDRYILSDSGL